MILQKMDLQEIQSEIWGLMIYDDVPKGYLTKNNNQIKKNFA